MLLCLLYNISQLCDLTQGQCVVYCDNKGALNNVFKPNLDSVIFPLLAADYDLLILAHHFILQTPFKIKQEWVIGHYISANRQLKHELNRIADELVDAYYWNPHPNYQPSPMPRFQPIQVIQISTPTTAITSKLRDTIYSAYYDTQLKTKICENHSLSLETFDRINWITHAQAFSSLTQFSKITISKHIHNLWHTASKEHQHKPLESPARSLCMHPLETPIQPQSTAKPAFKPSSINFTHTKPLRPSLMPGTKDSPICRFIQPYRLPQKRAPAK